MATLAAELPRLHLTEPQITPGDRLGMTLFFAVVVHAIIILGVVFVRHERPDSLHNTLDVVLVQRESQSAPEEVDYLAQANQEGGGDSLDKARPATPLETPFISADATVVTAAPPTETIEPVPLTKPLTEEAPEPEREVPKTVLAVAESTTNQQVPEPSRTIPKPKRKPNVEPTQTLEAASLVSRSLAMASLSAEIDQRMEAYAERPRRKWITARTREYRYAAYMESWRIKVERIGNLNYPDEARRQRLSGNLLLEVALNPNGSINDIILRRSSGHRVLDDAAIRIVKLSAPFAPLPRDILGETDILHIERTWRFLSNNEFSSR